MADLQAAQRGQPLHEQAYLALRSAILSGAIELQERILEVKLADQLQMSRTPVREAIRRLQQERLLTTDLNGGVYINQPSLHEAIKLYDCRIALEQLAVAGACDYATPSQLTAIEQVIEQAELLETQTEDNTKNRLLDLNFRFHRLIAQSADNPWLVPILEQLSSQTRLLRIQTLSQPPDAIDIHAEHRRIYTAIVQRDRDLTLQAITDHLTASQQRIRQILQPQVDSPPIPAPALQCPRCQSQSISRNGKRGDKQNYLCRACGRQFLSQYETAKYPLELRQQCLELHRSGISFREIERQTGINHNTIIRWVKAETADPPAEWSNPLETEKIPKA